MKRILTKEERTIVIKNKDLINSEIKYLDALVKRQQVNVETAEAIYERQLDEIKRELKKNKDLLEESIKAVKILEEQLKDGVEVRNIIEVKQKSLKGGES
jgi:3-methyladenine DNA glycosylase AlkD